MKRSAGLGLAAMLALGAGEAAAQGVFQCPAGSPPATAVFPPGTDLTTVTSDVLRDFFRAFPPAILPTEPIDCRFIDDSDRSIVVDNPRIVVTEDFVPGIYAWHQERGDLAVYVRGVDANGNPVHHSPTDHGRYAVRTRGDGEYNPGEDSHGVWADHSSEGRVGIDFRDLSLSTAGDYSYGLYASQQRSYVVENGETRRARGAVIINLIESERDRAQRVRPIVGTRGDHADAVRAEYTGAAAYGHIAVTVEGYTLATGGIVPLGPPIPIVPGEDATLPPPTGFESRGVYAHHQGRGDIRVAVTDSRILTFGEDAPGIFARHNGRTITLPSAVDGSPVVTSGGGGIDIDVAGGAIETAGGDSHGIFGSHRGEGDVDIDVEGASIRTTGDSARGVFGRIWQTCDVLAGTETGPCPEANLVEGSGVGDISIDVTGGSIATGADRAYAVWALHEHEGDVAVSVAGDAATTGEGTHGVLAEHRGASGDVSLTVAGGAITTEGAGAHGVWGRQGATGMLTVDVTGGSVTTAGDDARGVRAEQSGDGILEVSMSGGAVATMGEDADGLLAIQGSGHALNVVMTGGAVTTRGAESHGIHAERRRAGTLSVSVSGGSSVTAAGASAAGIFAHHDDRAVGTGAVSVTVGRGAKVTGGLVGVQIHDGEAADGEVPTSTVRVDGAVTGVRSAGVYLTSGGAVTVGATGHVSGGAGVGIFSEGDHDTDVTVAGRVTGDVRTWGDGGLDAAISGTVDGDVRAQDGGALTLNVREGGAVTGTVHDPVGPLTLAGSIGRLLYTNGATVTVAGAGRLTGVEVEGRREALRSEAGDLGLTVAGTVTGDVRALGDGDLDATISGLLTGDVLGLGGGEHTVTISDGGTVTGTIHLAASTVSLDGTAGRVRFDNGGTLTVGSTGRLTGIEVGGRHEAFRNKGGTLSLTVTPGGRIEGDVIDESERPPVVTVEAGGTVTGSIVLSAKGSEVTADGTVGRVRFDNGGAFTLGPAGRITGIRGQALYSKGDLVVELRQAPGETAAEVSARMSGGDGNTIELADGVLEMWYVFPDGRRIDLSRPGGSAPVGDCDVIPARAPGGRIRFDYDCGSRPVYEALPSVLLGLSRLPDFRERMAAQRSAHGGWARVEASRAKWQADESTTTALEYDHRRYGLKAGMDTTVGEHGLLGVSVHHRQGSAEMSSGGEIDLSGNGLGVSGTWTGAAGEYVDVQAETTWYGVDLRSARRPLKTDVSGRGHTLGLEVGRRLEVGGAMLTPRARLAHSKVSVDDFTDPAGWQVSLEDGRSLRGGAGVVVETAPSEASGGNRVFGSVDVEHEFSADRKAVASGAELKSQDAATWLRLGLNGSHTWDDGRYTVQGGVSYATGGGGNRELGGGLNLKVRF